MPEEKGREPTRESAGSAAVTDRLPDETPQPDEAPQAAAPESEPLPADKAEGPAEAATSDETEQAADDKDGAEEKSVETAEESSEAPTADAETTSSPDSDAPADAAGEQTASRKRAGASLFGSVGLYMGVALLAALGMGMVVSYRHQKTQKQLVESFTTSLDRVEYRLALIQKAAEPTLVKKPEKAKSLDDYAYTLSTANTQFHKGQFQDACRSYEEALKMYPAGSLSDQAHYRLGLCLARLNRGDSALEHFRVVVTGFPGSRYYARAALEMSYLLMNKQNYAQARRLLYLIIGSQDRLEAEDRENLDKAYYAVARCFEGEADVAAYIRQLGTSEPDAAARRGDEQ